MQRKTKEKVFCGNPKYNRQESYDGNRNEVQMGKHHKTNNLIINLSSYDYT